MRSCKRLDGKALTQCQSSTLDAAGDFVSTIVVSRRPISCAFGILSCPHDDTTSLQCHTCAYIYMQEPEGLTLTPSNRGCRREQSDGGGSAFCVPFVCLWCAFCVPFVCFKKTEISI